MNTPPPPTRARPPPRAGPPGPAPPPAGPRAPVQRSDALARTGADPFVPLLLSLALIGAGTALVAATRPRRP
ncbi:hypothetical protein K7G98_25140 [Saccharothrix sp. MB29]|nr:hypothetical protein [Saccharothrix sp. MB29]